MRITSFFALISDLEKAMENFQIRINISSPEGGNSNFGFESLNFTSTYLSSYFLILHLIC